MKYLPLWLFIRYSRIWSIKNSIPLSFREITQVLKEDKRLVANILSRLVRAGWVESEIDPSDKRKTTYRLTDPEDVIKTLILKYEK